MVKRDFSKLPKWRQRRIKRLAGKRNLDVEAFRDQRRKKWAKVVRETLGRAADAIPGTWDDRLVDIIVDLIESSDDDDDEAK